MSSVPATSLDVAAVLAVAVLLTQFALLRVLLLEAVVRVYAVQSLAVCAFTAAVGFLTANNDLYILSALTLLSKVVAIPLIVGAIVRRLGVDDRIRPSIPVPQSFLIGAAMATLGFIAANRIHGGVVGTPPNGLGSGLAVILMGLFLMVARPNAVAQLVGFLALENGVFVASLSLSPGLPLLVAVLLLLDVLIPAVVFVVVIRLLAVRVHSAHTDELTELRG
ncbi:MAG: hydrogenase [Candidatus Dormibacteria bacterium]